MEAASAASALPSLKHVNEALRVSTTARSNHGNAQRFRASPGQFAIEARPGAIAIHRSEQDFARAPVFRLLAPKLLHPGQ